MHIEKVKRKELLNFIDSRTFDVILQLPVETYCGEDRKNFKAVKKQVLREKKKFHGFKSPEKIKEMFLDTVNANLVQEKGSCADHFGEFSTLPEVRDRFVKLCKDLEI